MHHCFLLDENDDCHPSFVVILEGDTTKKNKTEGAKGAPWYP